MFHMYPRHIQWLWIESNPQDVSFVLDVDQQPAYQVAQIDRLKTVNVCIDYELIHAVDDERCHCITGHFDLLAVEMSLHALDVLNV